MLRHGYERHLDPLRGGLDAAGLQSGRRRVGHVPSGPDAGHAVAPQDDEIGSDDEDLGGEGHENDRLVGCRSLGARQTWRGRPLDRGRRRGRHHPAGKRRGAPRRRARRGARREKENTNRHIRGGRAGKANMERHTKGGPGRLDGYGHSITTRPPATRATSTPTSVATSARRSTPTRHLLRSRSRSNRKPCAWP